MGNLLTFETQAARQERLTTTNLEETATETPAQLEARYYAFTLDTIRKLVKYYQRSGRWTGDCDNPMAESVIKLREVCRTLAITVPPQDKHENENARGNFPPSIETDQNSG